MSSKKNKQKNKGKKTSSSTVLLSTSSPSSPSPSELAQVSEEIAASQNEEVLTIHPPNNGIIDVDSDADAVSEQIKLIEAENKKLKDKLKLDALIRENQELKQAASTSRPCASGGKPPNTASTSKPLAAGGSKPVNINAIRKQNEKLDEDVNKMLRKHHMQGFLESDDEDDTGEYLSDSKLIDACDNASDPLEAAYPHKFVGKIHSRELSFKAFSYQNLDTRSFSIGELDIASKARAVNSNCDWVEKRQNWHKQLLSFAGKYEWRACLAAHSHILDLIEEGSITWHDNLTLIAIPIISGHAIKIKSR